MDVPPFHRLSNERLQSAFFPSFFAASIMGHSLSRGNGRPGSPHIFLVPAKPVNDVNVLSDLCMGVRHHGAADVDDFGLDVLLFLLRDAMEPEVSSSLVSFSVIEFEF